MPEPTAPARDARTLLHERAPEWLGTVVRRRSRRAFDGVPAERDQLDALAALAARWRPYPDARAVLVERPHVDVFTGALGNYGKVTGAPHLLLFIADQSAEFADQHCGYTGEALILEATLLGLSTCWVGGFFSPKRVASLAELRGRERVLAVSPVGTALAADSFSERAMAGLAGAHHRKKVAELAPGIGPAWPQWAIAAVETARLSPSAVNRQPWRFRFEDGRLVIAKDNFLETPRVTKRLDAGIAMLHVDLAAAAYGVDGRWTDLTGGDVARFDPLPSQLR